MASAGSRKNLRAKAGLKKRRLLFLFITGPLLVFFFCFLVFAIYTAIVIKQLPSPDQFNARQVSQSTKLFDRTGEVLLYEIHGEEKRTIVDFEKIPEHLKLATLAAENSNFYNEPAFDWKAILRAVVANLKSGWGSQGGSTITQQLAKNIFLTSEKTIIRKVKELILAIELESRYSKDDIFSFYLNQIPYGSNAYGVEAASQTYFGKSVLEINLPEAAIIAALAKAPSYYSPWGQHLNELMLRKDYLLNRMEELGHISEKEKDEAKKTKIEFAPPSIGSIKAPHFSLAVKDLLIDRYGENLVLNGGLKVTTSLDWEMQQVAEKAVLEGAKRNEELYKGRNAALVAEDPKTGQILALVGSRDYFDIAYEGNFNVAMQGLRQPGSALKPFAYLTAFEKGYSPKTVVFDALTEFDTTGDPERSYKPHNYDDFFRGPTRLEDGLAQSINVPSVKILYLAGLENVLNNIHNFGITTLKEKWRYGLSLILGGGEVRLFDLVNAYATLSQEGVYHKQALVLKIENRDGDVIENYEEEAARVMGPQSPRLINQILSDKNLRSSLFQNSLSLTVFPDRDVALKTGTTNDYRDAWALGYAPNIVVGVWAGNNDNAPMEKQGGSILAAVPIWNAFLKEVLPKFPVEIFQKPDPVTMVQKPLMNGEAFYRPSSNGVSYPQVHSILYYVDPKDPTGPIPENPSQNFQFENWEKGVLDWAKTDLPNFYQYNLPVPAGASFGAQMQISENVIFTNVSPTNGEFLAGPVLIKADIRSVVGLSKIELFFNRKMVNGYFVGGNFQTYRFYLNDPLLPQNLAEIRVTDSLNQTTSKSIIFFEKGPGS